MTMQNCRESQTHEESAFTGGTIFTDLHHKLTKMTGSREGDKGSPIRDVGLHNVTARGTSPLARDLTQVSLSHGGKAWGCWAWE